MKQLKHITTIFLAQFLVLAIVFPSVIHFSHIFENHEHTFCGNVDTHLHEQQLDCDFTKFITSTFHFKQFFTEVALIDYAYKNQFLNYSFLLVNRQSQSFFLRGPPTFQHTC